MGGWTLGIRRRSRLLGGVWRDVCCREVVSWRVGADDEGRVCEEGCEEGKGGGERTYTSSDMTSLLGRLSVVFSPYLVTCTMRLYRSWMMSLTCSSPGRQLPPFCLRTDGGGRRDSRSRVSWSTFAIGAMVAAGASRLGNPCGRREKSVYDEGEVGKSSSDSESVPTRSLRLQMWGTGPCRGTRRNHRLVTPSQSRILSAHADCRRILTSSSIMTSLSKTCSEPPSVPTTNALPCLPDLRSRRNQRRSPHCSMSKLAVLSHGTSEQLAR